MHYWPRIMYGLSGYLMARAHGVLKSLLRTGAGLAREAFGEIK